MQILKKNVLDQANGAWTPLPTQADLSATSNSGVPLAQKAHSYYHSTIGELLHLAVCTRPDISFSVSALARQVHAPSRRHLMLLKRLIRYLAGSKNVGITYLKQNRARHRMMLETFSDADWAGDSGGRKSTTGYIVTLEGAPVAWRSKKQTIVALSSAEAEYVSMSTCAKDLTWIQNLFWEITSLSANIDWYTIPRCTVFVENTAAISIAANEQVGSKNKHISVKYHHV